jgi:hypothetical protein
MERAAYALFAIMALCFAIAFGVFASSDKTDEDQFKRFVPLAVGLVTCGYFARKAWIRERKPPDRWS